MNGDTEFWAKQSENKPGQEVSPQIEMEPMSPGPKQSTGVCLSSAYILILGLELKALFGHCTMKQFGGSGTLVAVYLFA